MKILLKLLLPLLAIAGSLHAQVYMYFPKDPATYSSQIQTDSAAALAASPAVGIVVELPASTADCGTASGGPSICTSAMQTFDNDLKTIVGNPPNGYKISIIFDFVQGGAGSGANNQYTPAYVFGTTWAGNSLCVGCSSSNPLDVAYCNNYQGSSTEGYTQSNVGSNVWNINTFPNGSAAFDHSGAPLVWEPTFVSWSTQLIPLMVNWYKNTSIWKSQMGYFRWGISSGGSSVVPCPNVMAGSYTQVTQTGFPESGQALSRTLWQNVHNSIYAAVQANSSGFVHQGSGIYGGATLGNGDGSTPYSWADDDAAEAVAHGLGTGTQSLAGNATNGDQIEYAAASNCSNDWCAMFNTYCAGQVGSGISAPICYLQTTSPSNPSCLLQPSSCGGGNLTGSLLTVLPFATQRHARLFEIAYLDMLCAYSSNGSTDDSNCTVTTPYAPYQTAIQNAENGVPASTAVRVGKTVTAGKAVMQ